MVSYCELPISNFAITLRQVRAKYGQQAVYATIMAGRVKMGLGEYKTIALPMGMNIALGCWYLRD